MDPCFLRRIVAQVPGVTTLTPHQWSLVTAANESGNLTHYLANDRDVRLQLSAITSHPAIDRIVRHVYDEIAVKLEAAVDEDQFEENINYPLKETLEKNLKQRRLEAFAAANPSIIAGLLAAAGTGPRFVEFQQLFGAFLSTEAIDENGENLLHHLVQKKFSEYLKYRPNPIFRFLGNIVFAPLFAVSDVHHWSQSRRPCPGWPEMNRLARELDRRYRPDLPKPGELMILDFYDPDLLEGLRLSLRVREDSRTMGQLLLERFESLFQPIEAAIAKRNDPETSKSDVENFLDFVHRLYSRFPARLHVLLRECHRLMLSLDSSTSLCLDRFTELSGIHDLIEWSENIRSALTEMKSQLESETSKDNERIAVESDEAGFLSFVHRYQKTLNRQAWSIGAPFLATPSKGKVNISLISLQCFPKKLERRPFENDRQWSSRLVTLNLAFVSYEWLFLQFLFVDSSDEEYSFYMRQAKHRFAHLLQTGSLGNVGFSVCLTRHPDSQHTIDYNAGFIDPSWNEAGTVQIVYDHAPYAGPQLLIPGRNPDVTIRFEVSQVRATRFDLQHPSNESSPYRPEEDIMTEINRWAVFLIAERLGFSPMELQS